MGRRRHRRLRTHDRDQTQPQWNQEVVWRAEERDL